LRKTLSAIMALAILLVLLSGCSGGSKKEGQLEVLGKDEDVKIKVMYWGEDVFFQEYGNMFATQFPNVEFEVVNMQSLYNSDSTEPWEKIFDDFIKANQPDVLLLQGSQFENYAQNGKLFPLDAVIEQDKFDMEGIHPAILKLLREKGDGKLYGLSPQFSSFALYYNIDLFNKYGVELPRDSMSWEEVFELAKRFPTDGDKDDRIYGLTLEFYMTVDNLIQTIGSDQDLRMLSPDATALNLDTDSWKKVFQMTIDAAKSGALYIPTEEDQFSGAVMWEDLIKKNLFIMGRSAMSFKYSNEVEQIIGAKNLLKNEDVTPVNWGIVTAPVDPNNRTQSNYFSPGFIFAVNANSANPRAAWEFVKYINSDAFAKLKSKSGNGNLLSRTKYNSDKDGRSMEPFYKLEPKANTNSENTKVPTKFFGALSAIVKQEVDAVLADKKSLEEALQTIQQKGEEELVKARQEAEKEKEKEQASSPSASSP